MGDVLPVGGVIPTLVHVPMDPEVGEAYIGRVRCTADVRPMYGRCTADVRPMYGAIT